MPVPFKSEAFKGRTQMRKNLTYSKPKFPTVVIWDWVKPLCFTLSPGDVIELVLEGEKFLCKLLSSTDGKVRVSFLYRPEPNPPKWFADLDEKDSSPKPIEKLPDCLASVPSIEESLEGMTDKENLQNLLHGLIEDGNILLGDLQ